MLSCAKKNVLPDSKDLGSNVQMQPTPVTNDCSIFLQSL